jgi:ubiquinone/menaquinone biosynthesis C-methylase UbiE
VSAFGAIMWRGLAVSGALLALALGGCKGDGKAAAGDDGARASTRPDDGDDPSRFDRDRQPETILRALELRPGMVVADIGAGTGLLTAHLARAVSPGGRVVATDIDSSVIQYLTSRMSAAGYQHVVEARVVTPTEPGLEAGTFDAINLAQVDHYFDDRVDWLKKALPALKPGGKLAISNRQVHRAAAVRAAQDAGFRLVTEIADIPGQFVAVFEAAAPVAPPPEKKAGR